MTNMKYNGYTKGVLLIVAGLLIAFFPGLISGIFYTIGGIILAFSIVSLIAGIGAFGGKIFGGGSIAGIIIGIVIISLPSLVHIGIPLIAGVVFASTGLERLFTAIQAKKLGKNWIISLVAAIVLLLIGGTLMFHPVKTGTAARILLGAALVGVGVFNSFVDSKNSSDTGGIIDVDSYTVKDDTKYLK
ncbi:MAG: DUF308 domain-containing protein [Ruminococcus sp.]|nr:DUF308 domain-containing protein [Ruminococcus sp.]MBQ8123120.1 DUF308 domain-containing protein [Ruminococcus sp.]